MDCREIRAILARLDTRFHRRLAGDRLFIPDELSALAHPAAQDPALYTVVVAGRAQMRAPSPDNRDAWSRAYEAFCAAADAPTPPPAPPSPPPAPPPTHLTEHAAEEEAPRRAVG